MKTFRFIISSPDGNIYEKDIVKVSLRGALGDLAILANHIPYITAIQPCLCKIELEDGTETVFEVERGLLSVTLDATTLMSGGAKLFEH